MIALRGEPDIVKVSFHALGHLRDRYCLLRSGGALGRGCGPLVVAREAFDGNALETRRELLDDAVRAAIEESAEVLALRDQPDLGPLGGVVATLRF